MNISLPNGKFIKVAQRLIDPVRPGEIRKLKRYFGTDVRVIGRPSELDEAAETSFYPAATVLYAKRSTPITVAHELAHVTSPYIGARTFGALENLAPYLTGAGLAGMVLLPKRREKLLSLGLALSGFLPEIAEEIRAEITGQRVVKKLKMRPWLEKYYTKEKRRVLRHYLKTPLILAGASLPYILWSTRKR